MDLARAHGKIEALEDGLGAILEFHMQVPDLKHPTISCPRRGPLVPRFVRVVIEKG
jgi:hypothetical protein